MMPAMSRGLHLVIALLLPLMVLRGLLPAGYMAGTQDGQLRIVMCSGGLAAPVDDHGRHPAPGTTDCPFALAHVTGIAPPVQPVLALLAPPPAIPFVSFTSALLPPATGPPRIATVRGPPVLS